MVLADSKPLYRELLGLALDQRPDMNVVTTVGTAESVLAAVVDIVPDVVLIDAALPTVGGPVTCARLKRLEAAPAVMVVDAVPNPPVLVEAFVSGADGYFTRDASLTGFASSIRALARGQVSVPRAMQAALMDGLRRRSRERDQIAARYAELTRRERQAVELLADGIVRDDAAVEMNISPATVRTHVQNARAKMGARTQVELAALIRRHRRPSVTVEDLDDPNGRTDSDSSERASPQSSS